MFRPRAFLLVAFMLAMLFQSYAAASMLFCATGHREGTSGMQTVHAGSHDHGTHQHASPKLNDSHDHESASSDSDAMHACGACGACGACHVVALISTPYVAAAHQLPEADLAEPFSAMATVSPRVLDKPPRT
ncbi:MULTISPECIES: hypothetical protein [unclassified Variovorax]|uniref:hypothetical protein n=1 Tax=unclassified Variovorax TaxID=663243 RepID=UPI000837AA47|nr:MULTISPECIES: hypothetical protein [unclassified Variovorax]